LTPYVRLLSAFEWNPASSARFVDGRNVAVQQRWAEGRDERLPALLADLISLNAAVIAANTIAALAAKAAGTTIPVVFATPDNRSMRIPMRQETDSVSEPTGGSKGTTKVGEEGAKVAQNVVAGVAGVVIPVLWFGMDFKGAASKEAAVSHHTGHGAMQAR
jgi:hypothetical protein